MSPPWSAPQVLSALCYLIAGLVLGLAYFHGLWWSARLLASGGRARTAVALMAGRFAVLGGVLTLASLRGAAPLLAVTLGVLLARAAVLRSLPHVLTP